MTSVFLVAVVFGASIVVGTLALFGFLATVNGTWYERHLDRHAFEEAYYDRDGRFRARGAYPLTPTPPESPAQRQLREWQERLDALHAPKLPTPAEPERLPTPFPPMPVPAPQYTPPDSPPGMARRSAR